MTDRLGMKAWATGAFVLAAVSACGATAANTDPSTAPSITVTSPSATATTSSPPSASETAAADATDTMRRYFVVLDSVRQHATVPISRLASAMTSIELTTERRLVMQEREKGLRQTGNTTVADLKVQSVNLDNSDPSAGNVPTVTIDVCWDVSRADLVGKGGQSVVSPSRADRGWTRYTVANYHWSENSTGGWRVADGQDLKRTPCAAS